jgi:SNF family Na+-dependent transporter
MYLLGLPFCTRGGQYWIEIFDKYSGGWAILIIGTLECICIGWVYGAENFHKDIQLMIGNRCNKNSILKWYWSISWKFVSPLLLVALIFISWIQYKPLRTDNYIFPYWVTVFFNMNHNIFGLINADYSYYLG